MLLLLIAASLICIPLTSGSSPGSVLALGPSSAIHSLWPGCLSRYPWAASVASSAVVGGLADCLAQSLERNRSTGPASRFRRSLLFGLATGICKASLSGVTSKIRTSLPVVFELNDISKAAALTLLDQALGTSLFTIALLVVYPTIQAAFSHQGIWDRSEAMTAVKEALAVHWMSWPTVHLVTPLLLPARYSSWLLTTFGFLWQIMLSFIAHKVTNLLSKLSLADNLVPMFSFSGTNALVRVTDVHDGDTCKVVFNVPGTQTIRRFIVRLDGLDTPEISSSDEVERTKAIQARNYFLNWLLPNEFNVDGDYTKKEIIEKLKRNEAFAFLKIGDFDKYGRLLGTIFKVRERTRNSVNEMLLRDNFAKPYDGGTKDVNWS